MKYIFLASFFILNSNLDAQDAPFWLGKVISKIKHCLQEQAPTFYFNYWCRGAVNTQDLSVAIMTGRNNFLKSALDYAKKKRLEIDFNAIECLALQKQNYGAIDLLVKAKGLIRLGKHEHDLGKIPKIIAYDKRNNLTPKDLYSAIYNENTDAVKHILTIKPEFVNVSFDKAGTTAFLLASTLYKNDEKPSKGIGDIVQYLLEQGADFTVVSDTKTNQYINIFIDNYKNHKTELVDLIQGPKKIYDAYAAIKFRAIVLPVCKAILVPSKKLQDTENIVKEYALSGDFTVLPVKKLVPLYAAYANVEKECTGYVRDSACPICYENYPTKAPVFLCAHNHTVCSSCFNAPGLRSCPMCRKPFSEKEAFWEHYQLDFCHSCSGQKEGLGFSYCESCDHVGVVCLECTVVPCCKKPRQRLTENTKIKVTKYCTQYTEDAVKSKPADLQSIDNRFTEEQTSMIQQINEKKVDLESQIELKHKEMEQLQKVIPSQKLQLERLQKEHEDWIYSRTQQLSFCSDYTTASKIFDQEINDRVIVLNSQINRHNNLIIRCHAFVSQINALISEYIRLGEVLETNKLDIETRYQSRVQERIDYREKLQKRFETMMQNS